LKKEEAGMLTWVFLGLGAFLALIILFVSRKKLFPGKNPKKID
jgi:hypothetical protein